MAVADALVALDPDVRITALGTQRGLETRLVPERGYHLALITPVPLPRRPSGDLMRLPLRGRRGGRGAAAGAAGGPADPCGARRSRSRCGHRLRRVRRTACVPGGAGRTPSAPPHSC